MARIRTRIDGKLLSFSAADWKALRARFDPKNAVTIAGNGFEIGLPCPLCKKFLFTDPGCKGCTFQKFAQGDNETLGCTVMVCLVIGSADIWFDFGFEKISWYRKNNKEACGQLLAIQEYMDKVERENAR